jgi:hypothetical protein
MKGSDGTGMDAARMVNGFDTARTDALDPELGRLVRRRDAALGGAYRLFYATPVRFARGEGVYLYDPDGNAYLDAYNNVPRGAQQLVPERRLRGRPVRWWRHRCLHHPAVGHPEAEPHPPGGSRQ